MGKREQPGVVRGWACRRWKELARREGDGALLMLRVSREMPWPGDVRVALVELSEYDMCGPKIITAPTLVEALALAVEQRAWKESDHAV